MVLLHMRFLPGSLRITVEDACPACSAFSELQPVSTFELDTVICKNNRKDLSEGLNAQQQGKVVKYILDALLSTVFHQEDEHEVAGPKDHGKQDLFTSASAFYSVHLYDVQLRICFHKRFEIVQRSTFPALVIHFHYSTFPRLSGAVDDFLGQVDVLNIKGIHVYVVVDRLF